MNTVPQKTAAMLRQRKRESKNKRQAVLATVQAMERTRVPITIAEVARRAGVSRGSSGRNPSYTRLGTPNPA